MFEESYTMLGIELAVKEVTVGSFFRLESDIYNYLKRTTTSGGYKYQRMETVDQDGFPDVLLFKQEEYCLIEAKRLQKKFLASLEDDLKWQFGQIGFAVRCFTLNMDYLLVVGKANKLAFIGQEQSLWKMTRNLHF